MVGMGTGVRPGCRLVPRPPIFFAVHTGLLASSSPSTFPGPSLIHPTPVSPGTEPGKGYGLRQVSLGRTGGAFGKPENFSSARGESIRKTRSTQARLGPPSVIFNCLIQRDCKFSTQKILPTMQTSAGSDAEGPPAPTRQQQREAEIMQTATRMYYLGFCLLCANVPIGTSLLCNRLG